MLVTANDGFMKHSSERFVAMLNGLGVKASVKDNGIDYDIDAMVDYAKKTPKGRMPIWLTNYGNSNLRWLLGDRYQEVYSESV